MKEDTMTAAAADAGTTTNPPSTTTGTAAATTTDISGRCEGRGREERCERIGARLVGAGEAAADG